METYVIKNKGKYLCEFMFKKGYDYRSKQEVSYFSSLIFSTKKEDLLELAQEYEGKIVKWK